MDNFGTRIGTGKMREHKLITRLVFFSIGFILYMAPVCGQSDPDSLGYDDPVPGSWGEQPLFPGGEKAMYCFIDSAINKKIVQSPDSSGRVILRFEIDTGGRIGKIEVIRSYSPAVDAEFIRVIKAMPRWIPGTQNGRKVAVRFHFPFKVPFEEDHCGKH